MTSELEFWKSYLHDLSFSAFRREVPEDPSNADTLDSLEFQFSSALAKQIVELGSMSQNFTLDLIICTALMHLLSRLTRSSDITIGCSAKDANVLLIRINDEKFISISFLDLLKRVSQELGQSTLNHSPLGEIINLLFRDVSLPKGNGSIFATGFFKEDHGYTEEGCLNMCDLSIFLRNEHEDLTKNVFAIIYNRSTFTRSQIQIIQEQLIEILSFGTSPGSLNSEMSGLSLITNSCKELIPDPRADLNFDQYEGAITEIFSRNAASHPDRICVNDTGSGIVYSYNDIERSSNVLAHYLVAAGLSRDSVVAIYSFRGVDLVVAIMGVIKAGLVYCVIDPAYPPPRQMIYIEVSSPKALILLDGSGNLPEYVENGIKTKFTSHIMRIERFKVLSGGLVSGTNIDKEKLDFNPLARFERPGIVLGPDSHATLSFTSGSTGIPKGVIGRHFSLTHFYPWMAQEFNMSSSDRFSMLSGISHDPIQRDIFTPLFLGASLYIPTADDIATTGRLAQWALKHQITVMHLTPAMGQLLTSKVEDIEINSLKNSFFVGDILTKKDVMKLQKICPNADVINMFGTTETQRAVSYYTVFSVNKVKSGFPDKLGIIRSTVPMGVGMKDVQLLVVNSKKHLCGVGEPGEVYVRSSGLAEKYLDDELTKEKFVKNWFSNINESVSIDRKEDMPAWYEYYKGPRDRMYKSGDLGVYRSDGNVESIGRIDDQIKIRGFRIELNEIQTHLSNHPHVRENVTVLSHDESGERMLVSYVVLNTPFKISESPREILDIIKDIRKHVKSQLSTHSVPKFIVPLESMPLTPNGKINKGALPNPASVFLEIEKFIHTHNSNGTVSESNNLERKFLKIVADLLLLPESQISLTENFFDLGGHSILVTRLHFALEKNLGLSVPLRYIYIAETLNDILLEANKLSHPTKNNGIDGSRSISEYEEDFIELEKDLIKILEGVKTDIASCSLDLRRALKIFITGATGFLGAFLVGSILNRFPKVQLVAISRASSDEEALERVEQNLKRNLIFKEEWSGRISAVRGDISKCNFDISPEKWKALASDIDIVVHNGALVHWMYSYKQMREPNVLGTLTSIKFATQGKIKPLIFVSSTSIFDSPEYLKERTPVREFDDLSRGKYGLESGYGQTKWVSEKLLLSARSRGMPFVIIRPGYIFGDSNNGITNVDDFLWRLVISCVELGHTINLGNRINVCPVDYVSEIVASVISENSWIQNQAFHIWSQENFTFNKLFSAINKYYDLPQLNASEWSQMALESVKNNEASLLCPVVDIINNIENSTKCVTLDDFNTTTLTEKTKIKSANIEDLMDLYIGYLEKFKCVSTKETSHTRKRQKIQFKTIKQWDEIQHMGVLSRTGN